MKTIKKITIHIFSVIFCPTNTYTKDDFIYENMKERVNPPKYTPNVGSTNNGDDQRTREYTDIDGHTSKNEICFRDDPVLKLSGLS